MEQLDEAARRQEGREGRLSLPQLLSSSLSSPVEDLVVQALSKIRLEDLQQYNNPVVVIPNSPQEAGAESRGSWQESLSRLANSEEELVEEELQLVRSLKVKAATPTNINMNVKYEFLQPSTSSPAARTANSVYFDQLHLTRQQVRHCTMVF